MSQKSVPAHAQIDQNLLAFIAHETRGPFNGLIGFSELLHTNHPTLSAEQQDSYSGLVHQLALKSFLQLQTLIVWIKLISDNLTIHPGTINLNEWIQQVNTYLEVDLKAKNIHLHPPLASFDIKGDQQLLSIALANLLYATLKLAEENHEIVFEYTETNKTISISSKYSTEYDVLLNEIFGHPGEPDQTEQNFRVWIAYQIFKRSGIKLESKQLADKLILYIRFTPDSI